MENQCKGCCGTCKYGIYNTSAGYVCVNGDSKYVTVFVKYSHGCDKYEKNAEMSDNVNHQSHYETGKYECIDVMIETQGIEAVKNFCICNAFKYLYRHENKNGVEDVRKAKWYLEKYLELVDFESTKDVVKGKKTASQTSAYVMEITPQEAKNILADCGYIITEG